MEHGQLIQLRVKWFAVQMLTHSNQHFVGLALIADLLLSILNLSSQPLMIHGTILWLTSTPTISIIWETRSFSSSRHWPWKAGNSKWSDSLSQDTIYWHHSSSSSSLHLAHTLWSIWFSLLSWQVLPSLRTKKLRSKWSKLRIRSF